MIAVMSERKFFRISISPDAKSVVDKYAEDNGMTQEEVASRFYEWFGKLPEKLKFGIMHPRSTDGETLMKLLAPIIQSDGGKSDPQARASPRKTA